MPTLILTRSKADNNRIAPLFKEIGAEVVSLPMIEIRDLPFTPSLLPELSSPPLILLTSREGAERWLALRTVEAGIGSLQLEGYMCVGERSARMIRQREPDENVVAVAESASQLIARLHNGVVRSYQKQQPTILYPCSKLRREETVDGLRDLGFSVVELPLYEPVLPEESMQLLLDVRKKITPQRKTIVLFFSPSGVENFFRLWPNASQQIEVAALGETTAKALREVGCEKIILPEHPTVEAMAESLRHYLNR